MSREDHYCFRHSARIALITVLSLALAACATTGGARSSELAAEGPTAQESLAAGDEAARRGDLERALAYYARAVGVEESADGWHRVAAASERLGHTTQALQAWLRVLAFDPDHVDAHQGAGLAYMSFGDHSNAHWHLEEVIERDPQRWRAHNGLGIIADRAGDHDRAATHFQAALALNSASPMLMNNLGYSRFLAGDLDQAARDFYQITQRSPDYEPAWSNLGMVYAQRGWYRDAVDTFTRVVDRATAHNDVGYLAFRRGDLTEAEELLREAIRLSPTYYPEANENLEMVRARMRNQRNGRDAPLADAAPAGGWDEGR
jgi:Flp pilus assembly protein TadD